MRPGMAPFLFYRGLIMPILENELTWLEASRSTPCPLCNHDHYCYLSQDVAGEVVTAICQWTDQPPTGWNRTSTAKDGRGVFNKEGRRSKRRSFPDYIQLQPVPKTDIPQWQDYSLPLALMTKGSLVRLKPGVVGDPNTIYQVTKTQSGKRQGQSQLIVILKIWGSDLGGTVEVPESDIECIATDDPATGAKEQVIEYLYPTVEGNPLGKVVRTQWSDRRRVYDPGNKNKKVRPWHWIGSPEEGFWSDRGKGEKTWPLYRETEAKEEILKGGVVFVAAGEQAVETYRELGLVATTCQGGESNFRQIVARLDDAFKIALTEKLKPLLVIHPDYDLTGENKFGEQLLRECDFAKIPAVVLEPVGLWPEMPPSGDIWDFVHRSGQTTDQILQALETQIEAAIDRQELELKARQQRSRWKAPEAWQGELGYWIEKDDTRFFSPKTDFDFQIERELASDDGGGLVLQLKRTDDRNQRRIFIKSTDYTTSQKFEDALKRALGDSIVCNLSTYEVKALIRVRLHEYHVTRKGKTFKLIDRVGQQGDGNWVFKDFQYSAAGEPSTEEQSLWVWNARLTGEESTIPSPVIVEQNPNALKNLVEVMRRAFGSNFYPAVLALGYAAAGVHYQKILEVEGAFPTLNLYGDAGSGKSTAAECALSIVGMHKDGMLEDISLSAAYEKLKLTGGLLYCLDDPDRTPELNAFLKGFYNGKPRVVRGKETSFNVQRPHSPMMVTSNHACGENDAATQSRLIRLFFAKVGDGDREAFRELVAARKQASGCFTDLIKLGYPAGEVHDLERELVEHLPHAHIRISKSLALVLCYAQKVLGLAGATEDLKRYVIQYICPGVNDPDEGGDSLRDFLEKLFNLQAESKVGEWNVREIEKEGKGKVLAVYLSSVWKALDKEFDLAYNRKIIESLLTQRGIFKTRQRFHRSEDESRAYYRALLTPRYDAGGNEVPVNTPETEVRFCYELPVDLLLEISEKNGSTRSTSPSDSPQTQSGSGSTLLISFDQQEINKETKRSTEEGVSTADEGEGGLLIKKMEINRPLVDQNLINKVNAQSEPVRGQSEPLVDLVDLEIHQKQMRVEPPSPPQVGDLVIIAASAKWMRSGSDKLPWQDIPKNYRQEAEIPLNAMGDQLFQEFMKEQRVISIHHTKQQVKVRNQDTGRNSVFSINDVSVLRRGGSDV